MPSTRVMRSLYLAALVLAVACSTSGDRDADAVMFRVAPAHHGVHPASGASHYGGVAWIAWTAGPVRSSPVVQGRTVYVGSGDGHLYAFDLATGDLRWRFRADGPIDSSPAVARGVVLFASRAGTLYGLTTGDGRERWRRETGPLAALPWGGESGDTYTSSAVIVGDLAIFGGGDGAVHALAVEDGAVRWRAELDGRIRSTPASDGESLYVGTANGTLFALDMEDGAVHWRFATRGHRISSRDYGYDRRMIQSSPMVADGVVYVGARDGWLYAVDAGSGRFRWSFDHAISWVNTSPAFDRGLVFAGSSDGQFVQAVDAATGREVWRRETALTWASPAVAGGTVFFGDAAGLRALDARTGAVRWVHITGARVFSSPWIENDLVIFGADDGTVRALRLVREPFERAVYWEAADSLASRVPGGAHVRDALVARGYRLLDAASLPGFLEERIHDRRPSAIVFAVDVLPAGVLPPNPADAEARAASLFRRYLEADGTIVWLGLPPGIWPGGDGPPDLRQIDRGAAGELLGVDLGSAIFDRFGARPTAAGQSLGLTGWWLAAWGADPASVDEALALDERGLATSWVKRYGGVPGAGFLQHYAVPAAGGPPDVRAIALLAERRPAPAP